MFDPGKDLMKIQNTLVNDAELLELMGLASASEVEKRKKIITSSRWDDLATGEKRLCVYFTPARLTRNSLFREELVQFECHVPSGQNIIAYKILQRVYEIFHKKEVNCQHFELYGQLGELTTSSGFFCCASRFNFYSQIT